MSGPQEARPGAPRGPHLPGSVPKTELMEFARGMDMGLEGPRGVEGDAEQLGGWGVVTQMGAGVESEISIWDGPGLAALPFQTADPRTVQGQGRPPPVLLKICVSSLTPQKLNLWQSTVDLITRTVDHTYFVCYAYYVTYSYNKVSWREENVIKNHKEKTVAVFIEKKLRVNGAVQFKCALFVRGPAARIYVMIRPPKFPPHGVRGGQHGEVPPAY